MIINKCVGCNPDGEYPYHEAHVEVWQTGDVWVPCCSDRVLDWWHTDSDEAIRERKAANGPDAWIRPLQGRINNA